MSAQHTPGPWSVLDHHGVHVLAEGGLTIASVSHQLDFAHAPGRVQLQNAQLIAAAPDLLVCLKWMVGLYEAQARPGRPSGVEYCAALNAIAKAESRTP